MCSSKNVRLWGGGGGAEGPESAAGYAEISWPSTLV